MSKEDIDRLYDQISDIKDLFKTSITNINKNFEYVKVMDENLKDKLSKNNKEHLDIVDSLNKSSKGNKIRTYLVILLSIVFVVSMVIINNEMKVLNNNYCKLSKEKVLNDKVNKILKDKFLKVKEEVKKLKNQEVKDGSKSNKNSDK